MQRAVMGEEAWNAYLKAIEQPGLEMVRIGLRPAWVGVLDHQDRFPERTPELVVAASGASVVRILTDHDTARARQIHLAPHQLPAPLVLVQSTIHLSPHQDTDTRAVSILVQPTHHVRAPRSLRA